MSRVTEVGMDKGAQEGRRAGLKLALTLRAWPRAAASRASPG